MIRPAGALGSIRETTPVPSREIRLLSVSRSVLIRMVEGSSLSWQEERKPAAIRTASAYFFIVIIYVVRIMVFLYGKRNYILYMSFLSRNSSEIGGNIHIRRNNILIRRGLSFYFCVRR